MTYLFNKLQKLELALSNSCYWSWARCQILLCLERHTNEAKGSIQCSIDPFASFACQTADNYDKSYWLWHGYLFIAAFREKDILGMWLPFRKKINWLCILAMWIPLHRCVARKTLIDCAFFACDYLFIVTFREKHWLWILGMILPFIVSVNQKEQMTLSLACELMSTDTVLLAPLSILQRDQMLVDFCR